MKLGDICNILNGRNQKKVEDINGKYPIYGSGGIMGYANDYICKAGSTIIGRKGSINKPLYVDKDFWNVDTAFGLQPKECCNSRFLFYLCKSIDFTLYDKGVTIPSLVKSDLLQISVRIPSLSEQSRIVEELDQLSNIIEKKRQQLSELDNLGQAIFYDMFGDPVTNEKGWEVKKLGEVCIIERGGSPRPISAFITTEDNGVNWIKIGDAEEGSMYINSTKEKIRPEGVKKSRMVHKGDFILSNSMSFGKPYILGVDGCIHDGWLVIRDVNKVFDKSYLYYYLRSEFIYNEFKKLAVGGVVNNLNSGLVRGVSVAIPPLDLQQLFAQKIEAIEKEKELIKQSIAEVEELFNSRLEEYFG